MGLGCPCIVPLDAFVAPVLAVLLDISIASAASAPLFAVGEQILRIDDIIVVSLPLPTAALLPPPVLPGVVFAVLVVAWEDGIRADAIIVPSNPADISSIAPIAKANVTLLPLNLLTRLTVCSN
jgi:hypothetical protein